MKNLITVAITSIALSGCFIVGKSKTNSSSRADSSGYKNRGQERKAEVHERNAERKAEKDAAKANRK